VLYPSWIQTVTLEQTRRAMVLQYGHPRPRLTRFSGSGYRAGSGERR